MRNIYNCNNCKSESCPYDDKKDSKDFPIDSEKGCFEHSHFQEEIDLLDSETVVIANKLGSNVPSHKHYKAESANVDASTTNSKLTNKLDEDVICKNYKEGDCPARCTFNDCDDFIPSHYLKYFLKEFKEG